MVSYWHLSDVSFHAIRRHRLFGRADTNREPEGLRLYLSERERPGRSPASAIPAQVLDPMWHCEVADQKLTDDAPTLVGIDHAFSFPLRYFEVHGLLPDWPTFLDDFQHHWPTDEDIYVDFVRDGIRGNGAAHGQFSVAALDRGACGKRKVGLSFRRAGMVAKSSHTGIPWLRFIRQQLGQRVHFWPFDGWVIPHGKSAIAEVYPALWSRSFARDSRTDDQHDAFTVAAWLSRADDDGSLEGFLTPDLTPPERSVAEVEGWILGVPGNNASR